MLEGNLTNQVSFKEFQTSLFGSNSVFIHGEKYDGKIIISKTADTLTPVKAEFDA